jgi:hypothetical protein
MDSGTVAGRFQRKRAGSNNDTSSWHGILQAPITKDFKVRRNVER